MKSIILVFSCLIAMGLVSCGEESKTTQPQTDAGLYRLFPEDGGSDGWQVHIDVTSYIDDELQDEDEWTLKAVAWLVITSFGTVLEKFAAIRENYWLYFDPNTMFPEDVRTESPVWDQFYCSAHEYVSMPTYAKIGDSGKLTSWDFGNNTYIIGTWYLDSRDDQNADLRLVYSYALIDGGTEELFPVGDSHEFVFTITKNGDLDSIRLTRGTIEYTGTVRSVTPSLNPIRYIQSWQYFAIE
jgi:hypothetical protein